MHLIHLEWAVVSSQAGASAGNTGTEGSGDIGH
jgi:hypothetical protein